MGRNTHKKRYSSRKKRGGLSEPHSSQVYTVLKTKGFFKEDDNSYNNKLLTEVNDKDTVKNAKNQNELEAAINNAASEIAANDKASSFIQIFPNDSSLKADDGENKRSL